MFIKSKLLAKTNLLISYSIFYCVSLELFLHRTTAEYFEGCHNGIHYDDYWFAGVKRLHRTSKYVYKDAKAYNSFQTCQAWCMKNGMGVASISSLWDYESISTALEIITNCNKWTGGMFLDGSDALEEGKWIYTKDVIIDSKTVQIYNETTPLKFQVFNFFEPTNAGNTLSSKADSILMHCVEKNKEVNGAGTGFVFSDVPSSLSIYSSICICEFTPNTKCWQESSETKKNRKKGLEKELQKLGSSDTRRYFYGLYQKTWKEALDTCTSNKMKLLDLEFPNEDEASDGAKFMQRFVNDRKNLMGQTVSFWLSGSFSNLFTDEELPFEFDWIDEKWRTKGLPYKTFEGKLGQISHGNCMSVGAIYWDSDVLTLSSAVCTLPHWFICYKNEK